MKFSQTEVGRLKDVIDNAQDILLIAHINPDGDAIGAALGFAIILRSRGVSVTVSWGSEIFIPDHYRFLPGIDMIKKAEDLQKSDCMIVLDCGARSRLGDLEEMSSSASIMVNIDHHAGNEMFGTLNLVDENASSTCELVYELTKALDYEIDHDALVCLYTGLVTDSGRFQYKNTTAHTHEIAGEMLAQGIEPNLIYRRVYERATIGTIKLLCLMLQRAEFDKELSLIYSWLDEDDLVVTGTHLAETENFVDYLRAVGEPDVAAILKRDQTGIIKVSLRSKEDFDVGAFARTKDGGGHRHAAGYTTSLSIDDAIADLKDGLRKESGQIGDPGSQ